MSVAGHISLRGVAVHNLKSIDVDIPHRKLVVLCGLSGSGKSSLALDTLYAEGQRRYIESFSAYTRQFLDRLEKPEAERIDGIPPAIAVTGGGSSRSSRSTVGTATEVADYLRLLFAKIGTVVCRGCGNTVQRDTPQSVAALLANLPAGTRYMVAFGLEPGDASLAATWTWPAALREEGFVRAIIGGRVVNLDEAASESVTQYSVLSTQYLVLTSAGDRSASVSRFSAAPTSSSIALPPAAPRSSGSAIRWKRLSARGWASALPLWKTAATIAEPRVIDRRPRVAAAGLQQHLGLRRLRHRIRPARAAAVQFQQPAGGLPELRGLWQYHRRRHGPRRARSGARRSAKGPSRPGTRRPMPTNWKSCWPWPRTTISPSTCRFRS